LEGLRLTACCREIATTKMVNDEPIDRAASPMNPRCLGQVQEATDLSVQYSLEQ